MKVSTRLFLAGAVGAVIGGGISHYLVQWFAPHAGNVLAFTILFFGMIKGCFVAAFIYDPKGFKDACRDALGEALITTFFGGFITVAWILEKVVDALTVIAQFLFLIVCLAISTITWAGLFYLCSYIGNVPIGDSRIATSVFVGFCAATIISMAARAIRALRDETRGVAEDPPTQVENAKILFKANALSVIYWALRGIGWVLYHGLRIAFWTIVLFPKIVKTVVFFVFAFFFLLAFCLAQCKARSAAMASAAFGVILGFFWWNPIFVGCMGGLMALVIHRLTLTIDAWIRSGRAEKLMTRIMPSWLNKQMPDEGW